MGKTQSQKQQGGRNKAEKKQGGRSKKTKKQGGRKIGKANSLLGDSWDLWLKHVLKTVGARFYFILWLTRVLCIRVTQSAQLEVEDMNCDKKKVWIRPFKKHLGIWKDLVPSVLATIRMVKKKGITDASGTWTWPKSGPLFPSRTGAKLKHLSKDVVSHAIVKARKTFQCEDLTTEDVEKIRSHSGRRNAISRFAGAGIPDPVGMAFAQIGSIRVYRGYVDVDPAQVKDAMIEFDRSHRIGRLPK